MAKALLAAKAAQHSRVRALPLLNLKKKRDWSQSRVGEEENRQFIFLSRTRQCFPKQRKEK